MVFSAHYNLLLVSLKKKKKSASRYFPGETGERCFTRWRRRRSNHSWQSCLTRPDKP